MAHSVKTGACTIHRSYKGSTPFTLVWNVLRWNTLHYTHCYNLWSNEFKSETHEHGV